jgi:hypothetical protein
MKLITAVGTYLPKKSMTASFLVPAGSLIAVKLLTAEVLWTVMTIHLKTSFVALWFLVEFLSVHGV